MKKKLPDDPRFKHVRFHRTDVGGTFRRWRRENPEPPRDPKLYVLAGHRVIVVEK